MIIPTTAIAIGTKSAATDNAILPESEWMKTHLISNITAPVARLYIATNAGNHGCKRTFRQGRCQATPESYHTIASSKQSRNNLTGSSVRISIMIKNYRGHNSSPADFCSNQEGDFHAATVASSSPLPYRRFLRTASRSDCLLTPR